MKLKLELFKRFVKFHITGLSGTVVDMAVLFALSRFAFQTDFQIYYLAPVISFEISAFYNYNISLFWVWRDRRVSGQLKYFPRFLQFNLARIVGFAVRMIILLSVKEVFALDVLWCNLAGLSVSGIVNFLAGEKIIFKKQEENI